MDLLEYSHLSLTCNKDDFVLKVWQHPETFWASIMGVKLPLVTNRQRPGMLLGTLQGTKEPSTIKDYLIQNLTDAKTQQP